MKIEIKKVLWPSLITSLVVLLLGILLLFKSTATLVSISYIIGGILIAIGVIGIIRFFSNRSSDIFQQITIVYGIISILAGIFLISRPALIGSLLPFVLGIWIIISSSLKLQQAFILKNISRNYFWPSLITALLSLFCGVILVFNPFAVAVIIKKIVGGFLIFYAICDIVNTFILRKSNVINLKFSSEDEYDKRKNASVQDTTVVKEVRHRKKKEDEE